MNRRSVIASVLVIFGIALIIGCGGGGQQAAPNSGKMQISVKFPPLEKGAEPAVIYGATNSITVDILDPETNDPVVPRTTINRPDPQGGEVTVTVSDIPVGSWGMLITGWEGENAGGQMVSKANEAVEIVTGQTTEKSIVMDGWPYTLVVTANPNPVLVDNTADVFVTPKDVEASTLLGDFTYSFESSNKSICTVRSNATSAEVNGAAAQQAQATANGIARGQATITATLVGEASTTAAEANPAQDPVTGTLDMIVHPNVDQVAVDPSDCRVNIDQTVVLTATAKYQDSAVEDIDFSFSSSDSSTAGVTKTGQNTAEITGVSGGEVEVVATQPYTSVSATCQVTVPYGKANVVISETD